MKAEEEAEIKLLKDKFGEDYNSEDNQFAKERLREAATLRAVFQNFILTIFVEHKRFQVKLVNDLKARQQQQDQKKKIRGYERDSVEELNLEYPLLFSSIRGVLQDYKSKKDNGSRVKPHAEVDAFFVEVFSNLKCSHADLEKIQADLADMEMNNLFLNLRVHLYEGQDNFIQSFELQMDND